MFAKLEQEIVELKKQLAASQAQTHAPTSTPMLAQTQAASLAILPRYEGSSSNPSLAIPKVVTEPEPPTIGHSVQGRSYRVS